MKECQTCKSCYADAFTHCPTDGMPTFDSIGGELILEEKYTLEHWLGHNGIGIYQKISGFFYLRGNQFFNHRIFYKQTVFSCYVWDNINDKKSLSVPPLNCPLVTRINGQFFV